MIESTAMKNLPHTAIKVNMDELILAKTYHNVLTSILNRIQRSSRSKVFYKFRLDSLNESV